MTARTSRSFLHSCLKVPIDPCNNCPAPIYNRPKMYLGRLTTTPMSATTKQTLTTTCDVEVDTIWPASSGIRSLAKLYDSIPDYCDINHLPQEEFYSTLDTLRTTCCHLKTKAASTCVPEESCTTSSVSSRCSLVRVSAGARASKQLRKKSSKKCGGKKKAGNKMKYQEQERECERNLETHIPTETPSSADFKLDTTKRSRLKSFKEDYLDEVEALKQTLKDFEDELKQRPASTIATRVKLDKNEKEGSTKCSDRTKEPMEKSSARPVPQNFGEYMRKSFSFNDLNSLADSKDSDENMKRKHTSKLSRAETTMFRDRAKMSNYFMPKTKKEQTSSNLPDNGLPKIVVESPSSTNQSSTNSSRLSVGHKKKAKSKKYDGSFKVPFSLFDLGNATKEIVKQQSSASPVHPVSRPNLAATLRVEVCKKKIKELQNNCTYNDSTPQVDWEVRKTPAWKSLALNESHKDTLSLRLATRKAEQALQQREYERNMELMRQRVKSAPLLLEGATYWGPNVGKLTHTCQREGTKHLCSGNQRKQRKKSEARHCAVSECSHSSHRQDSLRRIYASSAQLHSPKSHTKHNAATHQRESSTKRAAPETLNVDNDSGDELSSLDRAYL